MFYDTKKILEQIQDVDVQDITIGDDVSDTAKATKEILFQIEKSRGEYKADQVSQKKFNIAMLVFTIIAAVGGLMSAIVSIIGFCY